jgi:hypothetical protein
MSTQPSSSQNLPPPQWAYVRDLVTFLKVKTELSKADWVAFSAIGRT